MSDVPIRDYIDREVQRLYETITLRVTGVVSRSEFDILRDRVGGLEGRLIPLVALGTVVGTVIGGLIVGVVMTAFGHLGFIK
jgi:hypothetical protein